MDTDAIQRGDEDGGESSKRVMNKVPMFSDPAIIINVDTGGTCIHEVRDTTSCPYT